MIQDMTMRGTALVALWLLVAVTWINGSPVGDCPPVDPLDHTDHLPDDKNCSLFYKCDHAAPVLFYCPDGLHFNRNLEVCDWPDNAGCTGNAGQSSTASPSTNSSTPGGGSSVTPSTSAPSSPATSAPGGDCPAIGVCPQNEDENSIAKHLPHANNCSQFCKCDHGKPVTFDCPAGLHFNPVLEVCDWPDRAGCAGGSGSSPAAPSSTAKPPTDNPTSPSNPSSAPPSTAKPTTAAPSSPASPTSVEPSSPATSAPGGDCPAIDVCPQNEDENSIAKHLPHANNCSQFCKCDHGKPVTFDCPAGLHFNPVLEVCDWPDRAGCAGGSGSSPAAPSSTAEPPTDNPTSPSNPSSAPPSTAKPTTAAPSSPASPTSAAPSSPATSAPGGDCPAIGVCPQNEDENSIAKHLPHANNCSQFCNCDHGKPVTFDCPAGLHFNPVLEVCDWPDRAGCAGGSGSTPTAPSSTAKPPSSPSSVASTTSSSTPKPTTAVPSSTAKPSTSGPTDAPTVSAGPSTTSVPSSSSSLPDSAGDIEPCDAVGSCPVYDQNSIVKHLPHRTNCGLYCRCNHGVPITEKCPDGLHFNAKKEVCDWPVDAGCV